MCTRWPHSGGLIVLNIHAFRHIAFGIILKEKWATFLTSLGLLLFEAMNLWGEKAQCGKKCQLLELGISWTFVAGGNGTGSLILSFDKLSFWQSCRQREVQHATEATAMSQIWCWQGKLDEMPTIAFLRFFLANKNHPGHIHNFLLRWAVLCFSVKLVSVITRDAAWIWTRQQLGPKGSDPATLAQVLADKILEKWIDHGITDG